MELPAWELGMFSTANPSAGFLELGSHCGRWMALGELSIIMHEARSREL